MRLQVIKKATKLYKTKMRTFKSKSWI